VNRTIIDVLPSPNPSTTDHSHINPNVPANKVCVHTTTASNHRTIVSIPHSIKATILLSGTNPSASMPPRRKASASSPLPSDAPLDTGLVATMDSSPLLPKKTRRASKALLEDAAENSKPLPSTPGTPGGGSATEMQGIAEPAPKKAGRKRKAATTAATDDETTEPVAKRKKAAAAPKKTAAKKQKKIATKTPTIVVEDVDSENEKLESQLLLPLTGAVKHKLRAVNEFLDTNTTPALEREVASSNTAVVNELDLLGALIILQIDYELELPREASLDDAGEMVVERFGSRKVRVDFDKTCDTERAVQKSLARRGTGLEEVNLVEVEIEILIARRKRLAEDGEPAAGFRVYEERKEREAGVGDEGSQESVHE
jgi:hypothetical protein